MILRALAGMCDGCGEVVYCADISTRHLEEHLTSLGWTLYRSGEMNYHAYVVHQCPVCVAKNKNIYGPKYIPATPAQSNKPRHNNGLGR